MALQNFSILFKQYLADWTIVRVGHLTLKGKKELPCRFSQRRSATSGGRQNLRGGRSLGSTSGQQ